MTELLNTTSKHLSGKDTSHASPVTASNHVPGGKSAVDRFSIVNRAGLTPASSQINGDPPRSSTLVLLDTPKKRTNFRMRFFLKYRSIGSKKWWMFTKIAYCILDSTGTRSCGRGLAAPLMCLYTLRDFA